MGDVYDRDMVTIATITAEVDPETLAPVERLARERGVSEEIFLAEAIRRSAEHEADIQAFVQVGIHSLDRGDRISHDEFMAELLGMIDHYQDSCRA